MKVSHSTFAATLAAAAALDEIADAAKVFYALLTPEQRALADPGLY